MLLLTIKLVDSLTLGDVLVGGGTLMLAAVTYRLARATYTLDARVADRERQRREREVRGIARLIEGELLGVGSSVGLAIEDKKWHLFYATPHRAWDRDGAAVVAALPQDEAWILIATFGRLFEWEQVCNSIHEDRPAVRTLTLDGQDVGTLEAIATGTEAARQVLRRLAYPGGVKDAIARETEPASVEYFWIARWPHRPNISTISWIRAKRRQRSALG
jgi:hypothetical protein